MLIPLTTLRPSCPALSLLSRLVRPPGVPGTEAVGVARPVARAGKGVADVEGVGNLDDLAG